jgi:hypothetical protein
MAPESDQRFHGPVTVKETDMTWVSLNFTNKW